MAATLTGIHPHAATWLLAGLALGAAFIGVARWLGERRTFGAGLIAAALVYVGFALTHRASMHWTLLEGAGVVLFGTFGVLGMARSRTWLAAGWALHTLWDIGLHLLGDGAALAPTWYPLVCLSFDLLVAGFITVTVLSRKS